MKKTINIHGNDFIIKSKVLPFGCFIMCSVEICYKKEKINFYCYNNESEIIKTSKKIIKEWFNTWFQPKIITINNLYLN